MSRRGDFRHSLAPPECVNSKQEVDLVDVDGGDPSRVTLQGEEAARVLQTVNLQPEGEESAFGRVGGGGGGAARRPVEPLSPARCGPGCPSPPCPLPPAAP